MKEYIFSAEIAVRDYELDCEGVVNNANYLHYLEHTRHLFCEWAGFSFKQMQEQGIDPMLNRIEVDYFHQDIFNKATGAQAIKAVVSCVCTKNGKLTRGEELSEAFKRFLQQ